MTLSCAGKGKKNRKHVKKDKSCSHLRRANGGRIRAFSYCKWWKHHKMSPRDTHCTGKSWCSEFDAADPINGTNPTAYCSFGWARRAFLRMENTVFSLHHGPRLALQEFNAKHATGIPHGVMASRSAASRHCCCHRDER